MPQPPRGSTPQCFRMRNSSCFWRWRRPLYPPPGTQQGLCFSGEASGLVWADLPAEKLAQERAAANCCRRGFSHVCFEAAASHAILHVYTHAHHCFSSLATKATEIQPAVKHQGLVQHARLRTFDRGFMWLPRVPEPYDL